MAITTSTPADSEYVTLVSSDGFEFVVRRRAACVSGFIRRMLDPNSTLSSPTSLRGCEDVKLIICVCVQADGAKGLRGGVTLII